MRFKKVFGWVKLFRLELPLAAGICVTAGQLLALGHLPSIPDGILAFTAVFCLSASALILNDLFDLEVDRINAPERPLPSGVVTSQEVIGLTLATAAIGLFISALFGLNTLLLAIFLWIIGFLYNWRFKRFGLPGNLMVAISVAATFIYGAMTVNLPWNQTVWIFSLIAFLMDLGEEIAGDAMDMEGDKKIDSRSIALQKGRPFALRITVFLWGMIILLGFVPILTGWLSLYFLSIFWVIDGLIIYYAVKLLKSKNANDGHKAMRGAYLTISLCMLIFVCLRSFIN